MVLEYGRSSRKLPRSQKPNSLISILSKFTKFRPRRIRQRFGSKVSFECVNRFLVSELGFLVLACGVVVVLVGRLLLSATNQLLQNSRDSLVYKEKNNTLEVRDTPDQQGGRKEDALLQQIPLQKKQLKRIIRCKSSRLLLHRPDKLGGTGDKECALSKLQQRQLLNRRNPQS